MFVNTMTRFFTVLEIGLSLFQKNTTTRQNFGYFINLTASFGRFLLLSHFYSLWAHFLLQCKVLHLYGFRTTMARQRHNSTMSPVQWNKVIML